MRSVNVPLMKRENKNVMDKQITQGIESAIKLKVGKAPGMDRNTGKCYKKFKVQLSRKLKELFCSKSAF